MLFSTFLWRSLPYYDVKPANATFYGTSIKSYRIQLQEKLPTLDELSEAK